MNLEAYRKYNRDQMRRARAKKRPERLLRHGRCPFCEMMLISPFHEARQQEKTFGKVCIYWATYNTESLHISQKGVELS